MAVYATTDLHGHKILYDKIKVMLEPEDKVYFLGDANDRGPDGWELIKTIYEDPQFIYIKGNHEEMFLAAALDILDGCSRSDNVTLFYQNGGAKTLSAWKKAGRPKRWLDKIAKLPVCVEYINEVGQTVLLSHAGYTPRLYKGRIGVPTEDYLLWDRDHIFDEWDEDLFPNYIVVHGHTPTFYIAIDCGDDRDEMDAGAYWYCDGYKVCLDNACYASGYACLLNLDTWKDIIISVDDE